MKKIGLLLLLPSLIFASEWGISVNYPGVGVKYGLDKKNTVELRTQFGEDVFVIGPRLSRSISSLGKTVVYGGGEVDYLTFKGAVSKGSGVVLLGFAGLEYPVRSCKKISVTILRRDFRQGQGENEGA